MTKTLWAQHASLWNMLGATLAILAIFVKPDFAQENASPILIRIETEAGNIVAELYPGKAPVTVANFLRYVDSGSFNGGCFMRTVRPDNEMNPVKIQVIQAVVHPWKENNSFPPIDLERTSMTGIRHVDGAISMARSEPNSATSSFFICIGDQPELDLEEKETRTDRVSQLLVA